MQRFLIPLFSGSALVAIGAILALQYVIAEPHPLFAVLDVTAIVALIIFAITILILLFGGIIKKLQKKQNE